VGRLPAAMPSTISAADYLRRSALLSDDRRQVLDLQLTLAELDQILARLLSDRFGPPHRGQQPETPVPAGA
jgi:hypothetical protein